MFAALDTEAQERQDCGQGEEILDEESNGDIA